jgi:hypothetical protein
MLTIQHTVQGHCASICPIANGYLIAYYLHPECSDAQKIQLRYIITEANNYNVIDQHTLYNKTGNCILIPDPTNPYQATIIYSYFNDTDGKKTPQNPVQRWMYCSNWIADIKILGIIRPSITIHNIKPFPTQPTTGYLVRINPIKVHDQWILPMYHENPCYGQIMKSTNTKDWRTAGHIGLQEQKLIQPSLWWDGETLHSLSRDMSGKGCAWHSSSTDLGESWNQIQPTIITNDNNSIAVINDNTNNPYVIWNEGKKRQNLILGKLINPLSIQPIPISIQPIIKLNTKANASYPNYYVDNKIHIVHSEHSMIMHHIIDKQELNEMLMRVNYKVIKRETIIIDEDLQTRHL